MAGAGRLTSQVACRTSGDGRPVSNVGCRTSHHGQWTGRGRLRPAGFAVFADFGIRFSSTGRDFLGLIWTRLGESYTVRYPAGAQGKGKNPWSPGNVENGHSGEMLQLEGGSRLF